LILKKKRCRHFSEEGRPGGASRQKKEGEDDRTVQAREKKEKAKSCNRTNPGKKGASYTGAVGKRGGGRAGRHMLQEKNEAGSPPSKRKEKREKEGKVTAISREKSGDRRGVKRKRGRVHQFLLD